MALRDRDARRRWSGRPAAPTEPGAAAAAADEGALFHALPWLFAIIALVGALLTAVTLPPFMGPDEVAHAHRANLLTRGQIIGHKVTIEGRAEAGGPAERPLNRAERALRPAMQDTARQVNVADLQAAGQWRWDFGDGTSVERPYPNTAVYSPLLYLPQTLMIAIGKGHDAPVLDTVRLARVANALTCIAICVVALSLAGRIRWGLFAILSLPMSLFLFGVMGQDGMTLAVTALGVALLSRGLSQSRALSRHELAIAALCFALAGLAKAPYAAFALTLLAVRADQRARILAFAGVIAVASAWHLWTQLTIGIPFVMEGVTLEPKAQLATLLAAPWRAGPLAVATLDQYAGAYYAQAVGVLGWLDTPLDPAVYRLAAPALVGALALSASLGRPDGWRAMPALALIAAGLAAGLVFLAVYLTWTPVGAAVIQGVQGRYLLPAALVGLLASEGARPFLPARGLGRLAVAAVIVLPLVGIIAAEHAIIVRYYLD